MTPEDDVLISIGASPFRRWFAIFVFVLLGIVLLWLAFFSQPGLGWQVFFTAFGVAALWTADVMRRATLPRIELTREGLRTTDGVDLVTVENVRKVERGAFAFKPSHGFLVRLKDGKARRLWAPGLYWRNGTFLGVGGVVSAGEAKAMAEILTALQQGILPEDVPPEL